MKFSASSIYPKTRSIKVGGTAIKMRAIDNTLVIGNRLKGTIRSFLNSNESLSMVNNDETIVSQ